MTVYEELWSSPDFLVKRFYEQLEYLKAANEKQFYSEERKKEVVESIEIYMNKFYFRLAVLARTDADAKLMFNTLQALVHSVYGGGKYFFLPSLPPGK